MQWLRKEEWKRKNIGRGEEVEGSLAVVNVMKWALIEQGCSVRHPAFKLTDIQPPMYGGCSGGGIWTLTAWLVWLVHVSKARRLLYT